MMIESGSFPSRTDAFPAGLRVLVVDDDLTWLKILEKMLKKCSYQVTTCSLAREALSMLRERRDGFDIVISDVNMPDMNGFKLLEHVGLEMDLPVIMMSVDWETSKVMEGVQHGACDYLLKPVKMKELRNIWQHVVRKKIHEVRDIESLEHRGADIQMLINGLDNLEDKYLLQAGDLGAIKRRKDSENKRHVDDLGVVDCLTSKKARVVWSVDLHRKFVDAVNQIGFDKVGPKKVLKLMNVPGLTRENVASHLQKYRLYLSRMQKEETQKQHQDFSSNDSAASFGLQNTSAVDQNNVQYTMPVNTMGPNVLEGDHLEGIVSFLPVTEPETALSAEFADLHQDASISYQMGPIHSFKLAPDQDMDMDIKYQSLESTLPSTEQWMHQLWEPGQQALHEPSYPLADPQHHFQANPKVSFPERDKYSPIDIPSPSAQYSKNDAMGSALSSIPLPAMNPETLEAVACMTKWEPFVQEPVLSEPNLHYAKKSMVQEYNDTKSIALAPQNMEFSDYCYYNPEFFAELQSQCYDELGFHSDKYCEYPIENPVVEQGLFMV